MSRKASPDSLYVAVRDFLAKNDARGWRTSQVAEKLKAPASAISTVLTQLHAFGRLSRCELTGPGNGRDRFEYRDRGFEKPDDFKPLKPAKPTIVGRAPAAEHKDSHEIPPPPAEARPARDTSAPAQREIETVRDLADRLRNQGERFTPRLGAKEAIDREPASDRTAAFSISDDGYLGIAFDDDRTVKLPPADLVAMMAFLEKTTALWR